jgi:hypothetical protein
MLIEFIGRLDAHYYKVRVSRGDGSWLSVGGEFGRSRETSGPEGEAVAH